MFSYTPGWIRSRVEALMQAYCWNQKIKSDTSHHRSSFSAPVLFQAGLVSPFTIGRVLLHVAELFGPGARKRNIWFLCVAFSQSTHTLFVCLFVCDLFCCRILLPYSLFSKFNKIPVFFLAFWQTKKIPWLCGPGDSHDTTDLPNECKHWRGTFKWQYKHQEQDQYQPQYWLNLKGISAYTKYLVRTCSNRWVFTPNLMVGQTKM
jgi:hypothetical protein